MDLQEMVAVERKREAFGDLAFGHAPVVLDGVLRRGREVSVLYENELARQQAKQQQKGPQTGVTGQLIYWDRSVEKFSAKITEALLASAKAVCL